MQTIRHSAPLLALTTLLVLIALGTAHCGSSATSTQGTLGTAGGSLSLAGVRLDVPAGALTRDTAVKLTANSVPGAMLVSIEPAQLALAQKASLGIQFSGAVHISGVTEVGAGPLGVDVRTETATGASVQLRLDRFLQLKVALDSGTSDGGISACCGDDCSGQDDDAEHGDGGRDGEHGDGGGCDGGTGDGHGGDGQDGDHADGGPVWGEHGDGGKVAPAGCPAGFDCHDGVCVAQGGNHEHDDDCDGHDDDGDAGSNVCPAGTHCAGGTCTPDGADAGMP